MQNIVKAGKTSGKAALDLYNGIIDDLRTAYQTGDMEDAARLVYQELNEDARIKDFQVACSHLESLHSHDAVSVICKGVPGGFAADFMDFASLIG